MNIKFISSAGYQLWASEGVTIRYIYVAVCSPDMTTHEYGDILLRAEELGKIKMQVISEELVPIMEANIDDLKPKIDTIGELKPKVEVLLPSKVCDYEE